MERQKKDSKTGVKGFTMVTRCCLSESSQNFGQSVTDYQRGPQSPTEGHRGPLRATGGSGDPSQNICETKSTGRGEENYSPGGRKCSSIIQFMFLAG